MRRLNIYFIHSTKFDYNNLIYKKVLTSNTCILHNLILPMSNEYREKYTKDLMTSADIIIVEVSHPSLGLWLELKFLQKQNKPKLFLSLDNTIPKKYQKLVPSITETNDYLKTIEEFINEHASVDVQDQKDTTVTLGEL